MSKPTCPVCLEELGDVNVFITKCGHTFCGTCIIQNLSYTLQCPLCRVEIFDIHNMPTPSPPSIVSPPPIAHNDVPPVADLRTVYTLSLIHI